MDSEENNEEELQVGGRELFLSLFLMLGIGSLVLVSTSNMLIQRSSNSNEQNLAIPTVIPSPGGGSYTSYGGIQYNYEWGWFNYATGTFKVVGYENSTYNSNTGQFDFSNYNFVPHRSIGGFASITSTNNGSPQVFLNASNTQFFTATVTMDTVFHASSGLSTNTDNVEVTLDINSGAISATGYYTDNSHTSIDWKNILSIVLVVSG